MSGRPRAGGLPRLLFSPIAGDATAGPTDGSCRYAHGYAPRDGRTLRDSHESDTNHDVCVGSVAPSLLRHGARELIDAIPHGPGRTDRAECGGHRWPRRGPGHAAPSRPPHAPTRRVSIWPHGFGSSGVGAAHSTNSPRRGAVTVTVGLVAAAATNPLPPPTRRSGWWRRVPMLYGTRRGSRPALLPRVSGVTWESVTRQEALDGRGERPRGDSDLRTLFVPRVQRQSHKAPPAAQSCWPTIRVEPSLDCVPRVQSNAEPSSSCSGGLLPSSKK